MGGVFWHDDDHRIALLTGSEAAAIDGFYAPVWAGSHATEDPLEELLPSAGRSPQRSPQQEKLLRQMADDSEVGDSLGIVRIFEEFFVGKIRAGLAETGQELSEGEEEALMTPVTPSRLMRLAMSLDLAVLQAKCEQALTTCYARETARGVDGRWAAVSRWRSNNEHVYRLSQRVIGGVVQDWYLKVGRAQEKQAGGCLGMAIVGVVASAGTLMQFIWSS